MYCTECGNEIKNDEKFCRNCGKKIEDSSVNNVEINNDYHQQFSDEYMSKLAQANNAAQMFLSKEKPTWIDYNQVSAMYGQVEQIGAHINKTYINELDFFIKANLLDYGIYFDTVEKFEKIYDNLMQHALLNTKDENEKEKIKQQYNKEVIIEEFKKKLDVKLQARKKRNKKILLWIIGIIAILFLFSMFNIFITNITKKNSTNSNITNNVTTNKIEYGSSKYEDSSYGEKVVRAYFSKYGGYVNGVGKITSIVKSEFLEKDNYGRYAFRVTFKYNPINGQGATMLDRESTKTVIAIYLLNLDDPNGLYVGVQNVITTNSNWQDVKKYQDLCGGAWNTPVTLNFTN